MKRTISVSVYILFALVVLLPLGTLLSCCFGYTFEFKSVTAFAVAAALLSVCLTVLSIIEKEACESGIMKVLSALLAPLSIINAVFFVFDDSRIWVAAYMIVCIGCCLYLTIKHGKPLALKILSLTLSALMILPFCFFVFFSMTFGNMVQNTVVRSVESPSGAYCAEVIAGDQGALGGDTFVDVYENKVINALVFKISKRPQRVYRGDWGELNNIDICWKDDSCLVINSVEYEIE